MQYIVCFDISDNRDRYRVVKTLKGFGTRIQKSVFECPDMTEKQFLHMQDTIAAQIDHGVDSVYYFRLCRACVREVEWSGIGRKLGDAPFKVV